MLVRKDRSLIVSECGIGRNKIFVSNCKGVSWKSEKIHVY